ncbi:MAG: hypothetical protein GX316_06595 [Firmicutes bacterium]|nr:hypothetical protein [Bacillota bacterium]
MVGRVYILLLIACFTVLAPAAEASISLTNVMDAQLEALDIGEMERLMAGLDGEVQAHLPGLDIRQLILGRGGINWSALWPQIAGYLFKEIAANFSLLSQLVVLATAAALLQNLQDVSQSGEAFDVPMVVCLLLLLHVALNSFQFAVNVGVEAINTMTTLMYVLLPLLATTLAAVGAFTTAAVMHPLLIASVGLMSRLIQQGVFPILRLSIVLGVAGNTFTGVPLKRLAALMERTAGLILGGAFVGLAAVVTARGMLAPVADGVTIRAARFVGGKVMPVLGNTFSQALDVAVGGSLLIKNGLGALGLGTILLITAFPMVKILAIMFIYRTVTALIEPISDPRLVAAMASCASVISVIFVAVMTVTIAFMLTITVLVGMGNLTAVIR